MFYKNIEEAIAKFEEAKTKYESFIKRREDYKTAVDIYEAGLIYEKALKGE